MILCLLPLILGFFLDLAVGDPHFLPHPVRLIGSAISAGAVSYTHLRWQSWVLTDRENPHFF